MISDKLVDLVVKNSDAIIERWIKRLKEDPATAALSEKDLNKFTLKANQVLHELGQWVSYETPKENVGREYALEGMGLFRLGIPLCEGVQALVLLKRMLWLFVMYESNFESALELNQMRELNDRVSLFFDRAIYYFIRGYTEEMNRRMKELWKLTDNDTENIFFKNSFYGKQAP